MAIIRKKRGAAYLTLVLLLTFLIILSLSLSTQYINYWPTDSYTPYTPTAARLFEKPFLSQMHDIPSFGMLKITMRGKESLILGIALMQRLLNDKLSLYPNILLLIFATGISSILIFLIFSKLFDNKIGLIAYLLFTTSFWPYMYVLQGAHQPLVIMNCLGAIFFFVYAERKKIYWLLSGTFCGFMLFSSPTAALYFPYIAAVFAYKIIYKKNTQINPSSLVLFLAGGTSVFLLFMLPDIAGNLKSFIHFLQFSQEGNNFVIYKEYLAHFFPSPEKLRGGGIPWIWEYFMLIMPLLFPLYCASILFCLFKSFKNPALLLITLISLTTPLAVEISGVAQFGRNYYSWFLGIIMLVCLSIYLLQQSSAKNAHKKKFLKISIFAIMIFYTGLNAKVFWSDIYPARMATTNIYNWLIEKGENKVYVYGNHPREANFMQFLNNPKAKKNLKLVRIQNIRQAQNGYILIPPVTGKCIFHECRFGDFLGDTYYSELSYAKEFPQYIAASFETLASSKIWTQEEEICTYVDLMLGAIGPEDRKKGYAYLLDAAKLQQKWFVRYPKILKFQKQ